MQALDELNSKINLLLKKHAALETENRRLKDAVARHEKSEAKLNKQLAKLEKDMVSVNLKATINDDEDRQNMRRQLDLAITEIDRILTTLND